jgi:hypothetical protein
MTYLTQSFTASSASALNEGRIMVQTHLPKTPVLNMDGWPTG